MDVGPEVGVTAFADDSILEVNHDILIDLFLHRLRDQNLNFSVMIILIQLLLLFLDGAHLGLLLIPLNLVLLFALD